MNMRCMLCNGMLTEYSKTSNLDLSVNHCKNCDLYISGNTKEDVLKKFLICIKKITGMNVIQKLQLIQNILTKIH